MTLQNPIAPHCRAMAGVVAPHTARQTPGGYLPTTHSPEGAGGGVGGRGARGGEMPLRVLDLFSGIGGFSLGLERAGMQTVAFCEIDPFARRVLTKHWPEVPCHDDIRTLTADWLAENGLWPDVICGGFPCQDISVAGKGAGIGGERSGLWREYARLIGEIRPRYVIVENVAALLGRGLGDVLGDLAALGYDAEWHCIPASAVGAPHQRDRVWIVADVACGAGQFQPSERKDLRNQPAVNGEAWTTGRTVCATAALADPDSRGWREQGNVRQAPRYTRAGQSGNGGAVPILSKPRLEIGQGALREWAHAATTGTGGRTTEPGLGRSPDGSPGDLDEGWINAETCSTDGRQDLPPMWRDDAAQAVQRALGGQVSLPETSILRQGLHGSGHEANGRNPVGSPVACAEDAGATVRSVRGGQETPSAPLRRQSIEQHPAQHPDAMQVLSRLLARALEEARASNHWQNAGPGGWEDGISRVVDGPAGKVDRRQRLKTLGNAVVPQIPELIGRAIMAQVGE